MSKDHDSRIGGGINSLIPTNGSTSPELVTVADDGTPVVTSLVIANDTGNQHKNILGLIRENRDDLNDVGRVAFETRPFETAGGRQFREVAVLDEPASALLLTYLRNTPRIKQFKRDLVAGFYAMRQRLVEQRTAPDVTQLPDRRELAQWVIEAENKAEQEKRARIEAESRARELEAPASSWTHLADSSGDYGVADAAKVLSRDPAITIGRDRLFRFMAVEGWIFRNRESGAWKAYQTQIDNGRLSEKLGRPYLHEPTGQMRNPDPTIRVTAKGLAELHKRLGGTGQAGTLAVTA